MILNSNKCLAGIGFIFCAYFCLLLFSDMNTYYAAWGLYGRKKPLAYAGKMLKTVAKTHISYYLYAPLLTQIPVIALYAFKKIDLPLSWILAVALFQLHIWAYQAIPPAVLLLGTSRPETVNLRERLERGLHPYRIIVLLDSSVINSATHTPFQRNLLAWDNFRTTLKHDWLSVVLPLMDIAPMIVVDTRVASPCVIEEIRHTLNTQLITKTIFLTGINGQAPALDSVGEIPSTLRPELSQEDQIISKLKEMGLTKAVSPDDLFHHSRN
jgi:hypothetical protein